VSEEAVDGNLYSKLGCRVSCTVTINNRNVCVHDNVWKRCKVSPNPRQLVYMLDPRETGRVHRPRLRSPDRDCMEEIE